MDKWGQFWLAILHAIEAWIKAHIHHKPKKIKHVDFRLV